MTLAVLLTAAALHGTATVSPPTHVVGDRVTAEVAVVVDDRLVDPGSVRVSATFAPYEEIAQPERQETAAGTLVRIAYRFTLVCVSDGCLPRGRRAIRLAPARVEYGLRSGGRDSLTVRWPSPVIVSQLGRLEARLRRLNDLPGPTPVSAQALLLPLRTERKPPEVTYRIAPQALAGGLLGVSLLALVAAGALVAPLARRRGPPPPVPEPALAPMDEALSLVAASLANGSSPERRAALERLARELGRVGRHELVVRTRRLAWSEEPAPRDAVEQLVDEVERT
jgi:hypothetical protein